MCAPNSDRVERRQIAREPERVTPDKVYERLKSDALLLVCAYEDESKFRQMRPEGAILLNGFKAKLPELRSDQEIICY